MVVVDANTESVTAGGGSPPRTNATTRSKSTSTAVAAAVTSSSNTSSLKCLLSIGQGPLLLCACTQCSAFTILKFFVFFPLVS